MIKKANESIGFRYLLTEIQLYALILLELNIFYKKYWRKSEINQLLTIFLEYKIMNLLCVYFTVLLSQNLLSAGKNLLDFTNLFSPNDYKKWQNNI